MPSPKSQHEHEGRVPQVGVPTGPRQTIPARPTSPAAEKPVYHPASETYVPGATARGESPSAAGKKAARQATARAKAKERRTRALALTKKPPAKKPAEKPVLKQAKAKKILAKAPKTKPVTFEGHKTAGTPTLKELKVAKATGTLKVGKHNYATTPKVRKAAKGLKRAKQAIAKNQKSRGPLPGLGPEESHNAKVVLRKGEKAGATKKELLAAAETGLVESHFKNYKNQAETDADSLGWRQERTSQYGADATNVKKGAKNFFTETKTDTGGTRGAGMTAGQLAQTVQGSAFPERYDQAKPQAQALLSAYKKGKATPKQTQRLKVATARAKKAGLAAAKKAPDVKKADRGYVKVRADAVGAVKWAEAQVGTAEGSPKQLHWAGKTGLGSTEPWCANFVSNDLLRRGIKSLPSNPNYVPSFEDEWGKYAVDPSDIRRGDLVTFSGTHIGIYVGDGEMVSGNSSDAVSRTPVGSPSMVIRPPYKKGYVRVRESTALPGAGSPTVAPTTAAGIASGGTSSTTASGKTKAKLTPQQKSRRTLRKLERLGVGQETPTTQSEESSPSTSELSRLKQKYGTAA